MHIASLLISLNQQSHCLLLDLLDAGQRRLQRIVLSPTALGGILRRLATKEYHYLLEKLGFEKLLTIIPDPKKLCQVLEKLKSNQYQPFLAGLGSENLRKIIPSVNELCQALKKLKLDKYQPFLAGLGSENLRKIIPSVNELCQALKELRPNQCQLFLAALGSKKLQEIIKNRDDFTRVAQTFRGGKWPDLLVPYCQKYVTDTLSGYQPRWRGHSERMDKLLEMVHEATSISKIYEILDQELKAYDNQKEGRQEVLSPIKAQRSWWRGGGNFTLFKQGNFADTEKGSRYYQAVKAARGLLVGGNAPEENQVIQDAKQSLKQQQLSGNDVSRTVLSQTP